MDDAEAAEAKKFFAELDAEIARLSPGFEQMLASKNLSASELLRLAAVAMAGRGVICQEWQAQMDQLVRLGQYALGLRLSQADRATVEELARIKSGRVAAAKAAAGIKAQPMRDAKIAVFAWLDAQPRGSRPVDLAEQIFKNHSVEWLTAVRWERQHRKHRADTSR